jgi:hypothetical protein
MEPICRKTFAAQRNTLGLVLTDPLSQQATGDYAREAA